MENNNLGFSFPRIKSVEERWAAVKSNFKFWGYSYEESQGGGVKVTRLKDGHWVIMLWAELYDCGDDKELLEEYFKEEICD